MRTALQHGERRVGGRTNSEHLVDLKRICLEASQLFAGKQTIVSDFKYNDRGAAGLAYVNLTGFGRGRTGILEVHQAPDDPPGHALAW